jgi:putative peptide zinc metalloprotease protein
MRRVLAVVVATVSFLSAGAVPAVAGGPNNVVISDATGASGTSVTHSSVMARSTGTDELTSSNTASAESHDCFGCRAVAVAFQAVFATGRPNVVTPANIAAAVNLNCTGCDTFAFAFQYVVLTSGPAHLSAAGLQAVDQLSQDVADATAADLTVFERLARLQALAARFQEIVVAELVHSGDSADGTVHERMDTA